VALLCDMSHHLNDPNIKSQSQQKFISHKSRTVRDLEMKLKLFRKQL